MPENPGLNEKRLKKAVDGWRSLRPTKKFLGLTVDEFEAELKESFNTRNEIVDLENKLTGARNNRAEADVIGLALVARLVGAIKSDASEGEDSELLEAMGYVIKSKRKSGLRRSAAAASVQSLSKAA